jgi:hypothetical protein
MVEGSFQITGIRPKCLERLAAAGVALPVEMFERRSTTDTVLQALRA